MNAVQSEVARISTVDMTGRPQPIISVQGLTKRFDSFTAVNRISFHVEQGEIFGFLGPNGSGKTTTIRMLLGLIPPSDGQAEIFGMNITAQPHIITRRIGYMSQRFSLYPDLTVDENLTFYGHTYGLRGRKLRERKRTILDWIGLADRINQMTASLAGGWKQRLALGTAILHRPDLLFLDEPTAGVDPVSRREFWKLLYTLADESTTIFVTTHYMEEAEQCHRLGFIHRGELIAMGSPDEIKKNRMAGQVVEIICQRPQRALHSLRDAHYDEVALYGERIHVTVADADDDTPRISALLNRAQAGVLSLKPIPPSLEDVFIANVRTENEDAV